MSYKDIKTAELEALAREFDRRGDSHHKACLEDGGGDPRWRGVEAGMARAYFNAADEIRELIVRLEKAKRRALASLGEDN